LPQNIESIKSQIKDQLSKQTFAERSKYIADKMRDTIVADPTNKRSEMLVKMLSTVALGLDQKGSKKLMQASNYLAHGGGASRINMRLPKTSGTYHHNDTLEFYLGGSKSKMLSLNYSSKDLVRNQIGFQRISSTHSASVKKTENGTEFAEKKTKGVSKAVSNLDDIIRQKAKNFKGATRFFYKLATLIPRAVSKVAKLGKKNIFKKHHKYEEYGINMAIGGKGNTNAAGKPIDYNGENGHALIGFIPPNYKREGLLQFGIENSEPGKAGALSGVHDAKAIPSEFSAFATLKMNSIKGLSGAENYDIPQKLGDVKIDLTQKPWLINAAGKLNDAIMTEIKQGKTELLDLVTGRDISEVREHPRIKAIINDAQMQTALGNDKVDLSGVTTGGNGNSGLMNNIQQENPGIKK